MSSSPTVSDSQTGRTAIFVVAGLLALLLALPASLWLARSPSDPSPYARLGSEIGCQCGTCPARPIATCGCGFADMMLGELRAAVDSGENEVAIVAAFAAKYGPAVRIKPGASGLDLIAWLAPMALLLVGAVAVAAAITRWRRNAADPATQDPQPGSPADRFAGSDPGGVAEAASDRRYREIVERELENLPE